MLLLHCTTAIVILYSPIMETKFEGNIYDVLEVLLYTCRYTMCTILQLHNNVYRAM